MYAYCSRSGGFWQVAETRGWQTALPIARKSEVTYNWCILSYVLKGYFIFMEIEGTYTLQASAEEVWNCLMDRQTIEHAVPGLESLSPVDEHTYTFALHIRHAPLRGNYSGHAYILEPTYPSAYNLKLEGEGPSNKFQGECAIRLSSQNENTVVSYQGNLQLGRGNVLIPAPLVKATIRVLLQQFFANLTDQLRSSKEGFTYVTTLEEMYESPFLSEEIGEPLQSMNMPTPPTLLHRLVRRLGLSRQNPFLEELWVRRLRQAGIIATLLLLIWIGTRLPRHLPNKA